jgi:hypothetical protein
MKQPARPPENQSLTLETDPVDRLIQGAVGNGDACTTVAGTLTNPQHPRDLLSISGRISALRHETPQEKHNHLFQHVEELLEFALRWGIGNHPHDTSGAGQSDDDADRSSIEQVARSIERQIKHAVALRAVCTLLSRAEKTLAQIIEERALIESLRQQVKADNAYSSLDPDEIAHSEAMYIDVVQGQAAAVKDTRRLIGQLRPIVQTLSCKADHQLNPDLAAAQAKLNVIGDQFRIAQSLMDTDESGSAEDAAVVADFVPGAE